MSGAATGGNPVGDSTVTTGWLRRYRLGCLLAGGGLLAFGVSAFLVLEFHRSHQVTRRNYIDSVLGLELIGELRYQAQEARRTLLYALATTDSNLQVQYADQSRAADKEVARLEKEYLVIADSPSETEAGRHLAESWGAYLKVRDELIASMLEGDPKQAIERDLREGVPVFNRVRDDLQGMQRLCESKATRLLNRIEASFQSSLLRLIAALVLALLLGLVMTLIIQKTTRLRTVQASEARLRQDLESIGEELILLDSSGRVLLWNKAAEKAWQRPRAEVVGRPLLEAFPELTGTPLPAAITEALQKGTASLHSDLLVQGPGGERFYEARVFSFQGCASASLHDITARKHAEASQARLTAILEATPDFVGISNAAGIVLYVNRAGRRMTGHSGSEDITCLRIPDFSPDWANSIILEQGLPIAARDGLWAGETAFKGANGKDVSVSQVILAHYDADGAVRYFSTIARDISDQKKAEKEMEQLNRQLQDASRQAGMAEVATGVLHNVGNVLNSVNVSANMIVEQVRTSKTASLAKAVQLLSAHNDDLGEFLTHDPKGRQLPRFFEAVAGHLIHEQAALSKEVQGLQTNIEHIKQIVAMQQSYAKVSGVLENLAPHELVEDALRMSSASLAHHRIELVREFDPVPPVLVDRHKVLQILVNLVSNAKNALDARPQGRRLTVRIAHGENHLVRVEVVDNGAGIALENLTRIFQHGFTTRKSGHGFGLHSGANAARELGGNLTVHSEGPGHGAIFILKLPVGGVTTQRSPAPADDNDVKKHARQAAA